MRRALSLVLATAAVAAAACAPLPGARLAPLAPGVQSQSLLSPEPTLIRLSTRSADERQELLAAGIELIAVKGSQADAVVSPKQLALLKARQIPFTVLSEPSLARSRERGLPAGYRSFDQVVAQLRAWAAQKPDLVTVTDVGDSWEKTTGKAPSHDIWAMSISSRKNPGPKPTLLITAGVHAREIAPVELAMNLAKDLIEGYGKDAEITRQLDTREVLIVPVANPDGRALVEQGQSMWRKSTHPFQGGQGVDLNRNFDAHWDYRGVATPAGWSESRWESFKSQARDPDAEIYCGPGAGSEPETQAIQNLYKAKPIKLAVDLHAYGEMMIWPLGYSTAPTPQDGLFRKLWQKTAPRYRGGTSMQLLYPTCGTTKDFAYEQFHSPGFTIEVGTESDGFRPAFSRVGAIWSELGPGLKYLVSVADNPAAAN